MLKSKIETSNCAWIPSKAGLHAGKISFFCYLLLLSLGAKEADEKKTWISGNKKNINLLFSI